MRKIRKRSKCLLALWLVIGAAISTIGVSDRANADQLTGCLTKLGKLVKLAVGDMPSRPCNNHQQQVTINTGAPEPEDNRLVFVTSETFRGNLGGIAGADAHCQRLAENAGLPGMFRAWLSDSVSSPATDPTFFKSPVPYVRVNGAVVAFNWDDITDQALLTPIDVDENGVSLVRDLDISRGLVWTGTDEFGNATPEHCFDWTDTRSTVQGVVGRFFSNPLFRDWTYNDADRGGFLANCDSRFRLYCFEQ